MTNPESKGSESFSAVNDGYVGCPVCSSDLCRFIEVLVFSRTEEGGPTRLSTVNAVGIISSAGTTFNPSTRGGGIRLVFACEQDHMFDINVFEASGHSTVVISDDSTDEGGG